MVSVRNKDVGTGSGKSKEAEEKQRQSLEALNPKFALYAKILPSFWYTGLTFEL